MSAPAQAAETPATTVDQVLSQPESFQGTTATVSGVVSDVVDPTNGAIDAMVFTLAPARSGDPASGNGMNLNDLLVLRPPTALLAPPNLNITMHQQLSVTGPVVVFNLAQVEQATGIDLDDQVLSQFNGKPALVAMDVSATADDPAQAQDASVGSDIERVPMDYVGQIMSIGGTILEPIDLSGQGLPASAFTIVTQELTGGTPGSRALLVVGGPQVQAATSSDPLMKGQVVQVTGPIVVFDLNDLQRTTGISLSSPALQSWSGQPVMIATSVVASH